MNLKAFVSIDGHTGGRKGICDRCSEVNDERSCKFYTARGLLTKYALSCGYMEVKDPIFPHYGSSRKTTLSREHNTYHVKGINVEDKFTWYSFDTLTAARKCFRAFKYC